MAYSDQSLFLTKFEFLRAVIVVGDHADFVSIETSCPEPLYPFTGKLSLTFRAAKGTGEAYVRKHFSFSDEQIEIIKTPEYAPLS